MSEAKSFTLSEPEKLENFLDTSCSPNWKSVSQFVETAIPSELGVVCVDLDSVILEHHHEDGTSHLGRVLPLGRKLVKLLKSRGWRVVVLTSRPPNNEQPNFWLCHAGIKTHLRTNDVPVDDVTNIKPVADCYFDDKAVRVPKNWR
jgi:hypothetical protein